ncbi:MAG: aminodeoxychorismate/anthranilate synthase component II [Pseudomonadota bacterium]
MILIIDNYDSFVHNLARYVRESGAETKVVRNDAVSVAECLAPDPAGVVISPGPKRPADAGVSLALIDAMPPDMPLLGVCLGHQCLVEAGGGDTVRAAHPLHGEAREVSHNGEGVFEGIASPMLAGRYHSLIAKPLPDGPLKEVAWSEEGEVMAVSHVKNPWFGIQFHPESLLTSDGMSIIRNFLSLCNARRST